MAFVIAWSAIVYLALRPSRGGADWFWQADKLRHALAFATLWVLSAQGELGTSRQRWIGLALFGAGIEIAQSFTPDREASWLDGVADLVGMGLGASLWARFSRPAT